MTRTRTQVRIWKQILHQNQLERTSKQIETPHKKRKLSSSFTPTSEQQEPPIPARTPGTSAASREICQTSPIDKKRRVSIRSGKKSLISLDESSDQEVEDTTNVEGDASVEVAIVDDDDNDDELEVEENPQQELEEVKSIRRMLHEEFDEVSLNSSQETVVMEDDEDSEEEEQTIEVEVSNGNEKEEEAGEEESEEEEEEEEEEEDDEEVAAIKPRGRRNIHTKQEKQQSGPSMKKELATPKTLIKPQVKKPVTLPPPTSRQEIMERLSNRQALSNSFEVVGRTEEIQQILSFLSSTNGGTLFIVGPPGTGKSSSVRQVIDKQQEKDEEFHSFYINSNTFNTPSVLYQEICDRITTFDLPSQLTPCSMEGFFHQMDQNKTSKQQTVLVLDEVDRLLKMNATMQSEVADLLRFLVKISIKWSNQFKFLAILNGIDMYNKIIKFLHKDFDLDQCTNKMTSPGHLVFPSYSHQELCQILEVYVRTAIDTFPLQVKDLVDPKGLELCARKVAGKDGDARRALSMLNECARYCLTASSSTGKIKANNGLKISMRDFMQALKGIFSSGTQRDIQQLPRLSKLVLYVILTIVASSTTTKTTTLSEMEEYISYLRTSRGFSWIPTLGREIQSHLSTLENYGLVTINQKSIKNRKTSIISSSVTLETLVRAVKAADDQLILQLVDM